jgi:hypothetical protein
MIYTYGDYDNGGGGGGDVRTTRIGGGGGFLATETATRYVPGHTPSPLYLHDGAHRTGARHGCSYKRAGRYLYEYYTILIIFVSAGIGA